MTGPGNIGSNRASNAQYNRLIEKHSVGTKKNFGLRSVTSHSPKASFLKGLKFSSSNKFNWSFSKAKTVTQLPARQVKPSIPRPPTQRTVDTTPAALKQLGRQNKASEQQLLKQLNDLPAPPTGKPKGNKPGAPMDAATKSLTLPSSFKGLADHIRNTSQTRDLVETWNALTHKALHGEITSSQWNSLKDLFPTQLLEVARNPKQADQITSKHLQAMVKGEAKRKLVETKIFEMKSSTIEMRERLKNLRKP